MNLVVLSKIHQIMCFLQTGQFFTRVLALFVIAFCAGCGDSVVGVYQYKWQGRVENSKTFDLRSNGTCLYTSHVDDGLDWQINGEGPTIMRYNNQSVKEAWESDGNGVKIKNPDGSYFRFTREGKDLIAPQGYRYIKIR